MQAVFVFWIMFKCLLDFMLTIIITTAADSTIITTTTTATTTNIYYKCILKCI